MTQPEFLAWVEFYKLNPFDDYHRFYRPAALVSHSMSGGSLDDLLGWLEKRPEPKLSDADLATLKAFGLKPPKKG